MERICAFIGSNFSLPAAGIAVDTLKMSNPIWLITNERFQISLVLTDSQMHMPASVDHSIKLLVGRWAAGGNPRLRTQ